MINGLKHVLFLCFAGILIVALSHPLVTSAADQKTQASEPALIGEQKGDFTLTGKASNGNNETPGEWYAGETPPNLIPDAPVLLFVPGLNSVAQVFWEDNDMYQTAYDAGYQTAFIQLHDAGGASADMWDNGELLTEKIKEISAHFDGKPITVIAHSKGGVDTQTALTYYDAKDYVENVITLSSPHHGSQLADLAYSSWAGWLADLIGSQGEGTYAMQMGYMEEFRDEIDAEPQAYYNDYFTMGGTNWGSAFSSTWFGGMYLSQFGENDGVVTTASSSLSRGHEIAIGDWNHTTIRTGANFRTFEDFITDNGVPRNFTATSDSLSKNSNSPAYNQWVHGGQLPGEKEKTIIISVEENVKQLHLQLLTADQLSTIKLTDPSGKEIIPKFKVDKVTEGYFAGAISNRLVIEKPEPGQWQLHVEAEHDDAYLFMADFKTAEPKLYRSQKKMEKDQLTYLLNIDSSQVVDGSLRVTFHVTDTKNPSNTKTFSVNGSADLSRVIQLDQVDTVYNVTIDIAGKTKEGNIFKRTVVDSVYY
ncbi:esterase/lipase family protein [Virgibacillus sp. FSP13]